MAFDDLLGKAKGLLGEHDDKVDQALEKVGDAAKERFAGHDEQIDSLVDKAQAYDFSGGEAPAEEQPETPAE